MAFLISNLLLEAIFDFRKWSNGKYKNTMSFEEFWSISKKSKNGFPIVFSKSDSTWVRFYFWQKKNSEKAKHPRISRSFVGYMPEALF